MPSETFLLSVVFCVVTPLMAGYVTRRLLDDIGDPSRIAAFTGRIKPFPIMGLIATALLLFGFQAQKIFGQPGVIVLITMPMLILSDGIFPGRLRLVEGQKVVSLGVFSRQSEISVDRAVSSTSQP